MNRLVSGAVAGAAGIALLLGGAGTFALWNDATTASAGVVASGTLSIATPSGDGTWTNTSAGGVTTTIPTSRLSSHPLVPGDTLTFRQSVDVVADGQGLTALLGIDTSTMSFVGSALAAQLGDTLTLNIPGAPANVTRVDAHTYRITGASGTMHLSVVATLGFPLGAIGDNSAQGESLDLTKLAITLQQTLE